MADQDHQWDELCNTVTTSPHLLTSEEMLARASDTQEFLIADRIPARAITIIMGAPGAKKSWLAYHTALCVARGEPWLDEATPAIGSVLILNYDNSTPECARRFMRLGMSASDPIYFHTLIDGSAQYRVPNRADRESDFLPLVAMASRVKPSLIVFDTFRQGAEGNENSSEEMAIVMRHMKRLTAGGCAVLLLHHSTKSSEADASGGARGSGEIIGSADASILIQEDDDEDSLSLATWKKHRCWPMANANKVLEFEVVDEGTKTLIRRRH